MRLVIACTCAALLALALDGAGVWLERIELLRLGGLLAWVAIALGLWALGVRSARPSAPRAGWVLLLSAVPMLGLARWVRGSAGVPPDAPLLVLQAVACGLLMMVVMRERLSARGQSPAAAQPPLQG